MWFLPPFASDCINVLYSDVLLLTLLLSQLLAQVYGSTRLAHGPLRGEDLLLVSDMDEILRDEVRAVRESRWSHSQ